MTSSIYQRTIRDIESKIGNNGTNVYVLFSGGKDSLATLSLVTEACKPLNKKVVAVHADTTVGIPDNLGYVTTACQQLMSELVIVRPKRDYFELAQHKGLPRFGARWCCGELKVKPLSIYFSSQPGSKIILDGIRSEESKIREVMPRMSWHKHFSSYVYHPIKDWTSEQLYSYLAEQNLSLNPLYAKGFRRASECWCGVFKGVAEFKILKDTYPDFFNKLVELEASMRNGSSYLFKNGKKVYLKDLLKDNDNGD
jgi:3'-phosphoadenosine 5'-phosphosulfate sulfotransferase (PAPS reductase)/FAD synthetase